MNNEQIAFKLGDRVINKTLKGTSIGTVIGFYDNYLWINFDDSCVCTGRIDEYKHHYQPPAEKIPEKLDERYVIHGVEITKAFNFLIDYLHSEARMKKAGI